MVEPQRDEQQAATGQGLTKLLSALQATLNLTPVPTRLLQTLIDPLHPADLAHVLETLTPEQRVQLLPVIPADELGEVLAELGDTVQRQLLDEMEPAEVLAAVEELESDDIADIIQHLDDEAREAVIAQLSDKKQERLANYDPETAGGLMQYEIVTATPDMTIEDLLRVLRTRKKDLPDNIGKIFVVGARRQLLGTLSVNQLVRKSLKSKLGNVMNKDPITIPVDMSVKDVADIFEKYDLHNAAVVTHQGYLLGRIAIDDVLDVIREEHDKELLRSQGLGDDTDLFAPAKTTAKQRLPWLIVNLGTAILASAVIALFEEQIAQLVVLAVLMPIIASMGGNAGMQTLTVMVRGLAFNQVTWGNVWYLLKKEISVGSFNGIFLGVGLGIGTMLIYRNVPLGIVICLATIGNHLLAAIFGHLIPFVLHKLGRDPAVSGSIILTTFTDVGGFFLFLGLAGLILL